jgi:hypothetical protein
MLGTPGILVKGALMKQVKVFLSGIAEPVYLTGAAAESFEQMVWAGAPAQGKMHPMEPPQGRLFANRFFRIQSEGMTRIININQIAHVEITQTKD